MRQAAIDEEITEQLISSKLADWYPQVLFSISAEHYWQIPVSIVGGTPVPVTLTNSSSGIFSVSQTLFSRDVLLASSTASDVREQAKHRTASTTIDVVVNVSKAFYGALLTREQIALTDDDIVRLQQSFKDATSQYHSGVVDKTDYERAMVALNNARAERTQDEQLLKARYASLKEQMGYPPLGALTLEYDTTQMEREVHLDTTQSVVYDRRVEFQLLQVQKRLAEAEVDYHRLAFLPSLSAFGGYGLNYQSTDLRRLYNHNYPDSFIGLQLSLPIFEGGKRIQELKQAEWELNRVDFDITAFELAANREYVEAMATYTSNLNTYRVLKQNLDLARDVYHTIQLQYKAGTKTYLELISAETDLRSAEVNHTNALYQVLTSKLDVQKALGTIVP